MATDERAELILAEVQRCTELLQGLPPKWATQVADKLFTGTDYTGCGKKHVVWIIARWCAVGGHVSTNSGATLEERKVRFLREASYAFQRCGDQHQKKATNAHRHSKELMSQAEHLDDLTHS